MGAAVPIIGLAVGAGLGLWGVNEQKKQFREQKKTMKEEREKQLALEDRAADDEKRRTALADANLLRQRQRSLFAASGKPTGTLKTSPQGVLGAAPTAGKSALGY